MENLLESYCVRWGLRPVNSAIETRTSTTLKVAYAAGEAALKCAKPGIDEASAAGILKWFGGAGSVRLLRHDRGAMLLEWIDGSPLSDLVRDGRDGDAAEILADVACRLHAPRSKPLAGVPSLERRMAPLLALRDTADPLVQEAAALAGRLLETSNDKRPLHGDLHHDNILHHAERGWLAIDPKGVIGDPHYDLANALCNPVQHPEIVRDANRVETQARIFAGRLGLDARRLVSFAFCHACLAAIWCTQDGDDPRHWREMARIIHQRMPRER